MKQIAAEHHKPVSAVAVRFILDYLPGSAVLCGAKRPDQILGNAEAFGWQLTEENLNQLDMISR
jgi:aryl-alcohol dehydrogenase-like predicted oxidoreductase